MLQQVAAGRSMLQHVAVGCSRLQWVAVDEVSTCKGYSTTGMCGKGAYCSAELWALNGGLSRRAAGVVCSRAGAAGDQGAVRQHYHRRMVSPHS